MSLRKSAGNMYPWVTHTHSHLVGRCPHECGYCYVQAMERRYKSGRYVGDVRLDEAELSVNYGSGRVIFIEHMNDLCADGVQTEWIEAIMGHCCRYPENGYVFQSKNPLRFTHWLPSMPPRFMLGTTIETTRPTDGNAPIPLVRAEGMRLLRDKLPEATLFVTVEPILELSVETMLVWLREIRPTFVNVGADSKGHDLTEPSSDHVRALIAGIQALGIEIRQKRNLDRLLGEPAPEDKETTK